MTEQVENVLAVLEKLRTNNEITYSAYSELHDEISLLDNLLKEQADQIKKLELERSWDESPDMMGKW